VELREYIQSVIIREAGRPRVEAATWPWTYLLMQTSKGER